MSGSNYAENGIELAEVGDLADKYWCEDCGAGWWRTRSLGFPADCPNKCRRPKAGAGSFLVQEANTKRHRLWRCTRCEYAFWRAKRDVPTKCWKCGGRETKRWRCRICRDAFTREPGTVPSDCPRRCLGKYPELHHLGPPVRVHEQKGRGLTCGTCGLWRPLPMQGRAPGCPNGCDKPVKKTLHECQYCGDKYIWPNTAEGRKAVPDCPKGCKAAQKEKNFARLHGEPKPGKICADCLVYYRDERCPRCGTEPAREEVMLKKKVDEYVMAVRARQRSEEYLESQKVSLMEIVRDRRQVEFQVGNELAKVANMKPHTERYLRAGDGLAVKLTVGGGGHGGGASAELIELETPTEDKRG